MQCFSFCFVFLICKGQNDTMTAMLTVKKLFHSIKKITSICSIKMEQSSFSNLGWIAPKIWASTYLCKMERVTSDIATPWCSFWTPIKQEGHIHGQILPLIHTGGSVCWARAIKTSLGFCVAAKVYLRRPYCRIGALGLNAAKSNSYAVCTV